MPTSTTAANLPFQSRALCRVVASLSGPNWSADAARIAVAQWGEFMFTASREVENRCPRWILFTYPNSVIVCMNGTTTAEQGAALVLGYLLGPDNSELALGVNRTLALMGETSLFDVLEEQQRGKEHCIFGGHSLGGAVLMFQALRQWRRSRQCNVSIATFGSPKPGGLNFSLAFREIPCVRYMTRGDPVPLVFPNPTQAPLANVLFTYTESTNVSRFVQVDGGTQFTSTGGLEARDIPSDPPVITELSLGSWLATLAADAQNAHSMTNYLGNMEAYCATLPPEAPILPPIAPAERRGHEQTRRELVAQQVEVGRALVAQRDTPGQAPPLVPRYQAFRAEKAGTLWGVTFRGQWIAWAMRRKRATHMAFLGNRFLKEMLKVGIFYPDEYTLEYENWMRDAAQGGHGITPRLPVEFPRSV